MDFTINTYKLLLSSLIEQKYVFQSFQEFIKKPVPRSVILRHDVDKHPENALIFAKIQHDLDIKGSYFFRIVKQSYNASIIDKIASLGHEIGYHYEDLTIAKGNTDKAYELFKQNLQILNQHYPIKTICMHGSPLSKWDSKNIWKKYDYKQLNIIGEPYFDVNFEKVLYLTDTGRRWDGNKVSVRDKTNAPNSLDKKYNIKSTQQLINSIKRNKLANQIMFTFHPQRWHDKCRLWIKELILQKIKNIIKKVFFVKN